MQNGIQLDVRRPTWAEVDLRQLERNYAAIRSHVDSHVKIMAVVKADSYGHGAIEVSRALVEAGVDCLAVALVEEGVALRQSGIATPTVVLGGFWPGQEQALIDNRLTPTIYDPDALKRLAEAARHAGKLVSYHLKVDTGMGRLGIPYQEVMDFLAHTLSHDSVKLGGVFTHFSSADEDEDEFTDIQVKRFQGVLHQMRDAGIQLEMAHAANSAGTLFHPQSWFDMVRPGLVLYGINPNEQQGLFPIAPVLSLKTRIAFLKRVPLGSPLGYSRTFTTKEESLIATLPIGYGDGLNRLLSNQGKVIVRDTFAPIVGRISMDYTIIDVTDIPNVATRDEVIIIGKSVALSITAQDIATQVQSIPYEVLCRIGPRVPRTFLH